ncbi:hypothetical protein NMY22_g8174 [Coprinellus aureogranulatus]|nr:hypothetical protein NMY22_g8174 [Coprinellus aureogranulatus]
MSGNRHKFSFRRIVSLAFSKKRAQNLSVNSDSEQHVVGASVAYSLAVSGEKQSSSQEGQQAPAVQCAHTNSPEAPTAPSSYPYLADSSISPPRNLPPPLLLSQSLFAGATNFHLEQLNIVNALTPGSNQDLASSEGWKLLLQNTAPNALYDSSARFDPPKCDPDTRVGILDEIMGWMRDREGPTRILCLTGAAGAGKSALQQTIAERCAHEKILASTFFFATSDYTRNNISKLVPTMAYQMALTNIRFRRLLVDAVIEDPLVFERALRTQFDSLIARPWMEFQAGRGEEVDSFPYIALLDGLDECLDVHRQGELLVAIKDTLLSMPGLPFRIFLSSRPEWPIRSALEPAGHFHSCAYHIRLSDDYDATEDIRLMLWRRLKDVGSRCGDPRAHPDIWPTKQDIKQLVKAASGQFIYAATVVKYVGEIRSSPFDRLQTVLTWKPDPEQRAKPFAQLDLLYSNIVSSAKAAYDAVDTNEHDFMLLLAVFHRDWHNVSRGGVGRYYSLEGIQQALALPANTFSCLLSDLQSLVRAHRPFKNREDWHYLDFYHRSFSEWMGHESRSKRFFVPDDAVDEFMVTRLLRDSNSHPSAVVYMPSLPCLANDTLSPPLQQLFCTYLTTWTPWLERYRRHPDKRRLPGVVTVLGETLGVLSEDVDADPTLVARLEEELLEFRSSSIQLTRKMICLKSPLHHRLPKAAGKQISYKLMRPHDEVASSRLQWFNLRDTPKVLADAFILDLSLHPQNIRKGYTTYWPLWLSYPKASSPLVLKEVYYSSKAKSSPEHQRDLKHLLRSCALVNSAWRKPAQTLLFRSVVCNPRFVRTFLGDEDSKSSLLQHVRTIDFSIPVHHVHPRVLDEFGKFIRLALERCPSIYEVALRGGGDNAVSDELLSGIRERLTSQTSASPLRSLRVYWRDPRTTFPYRVPSYFPSLRYLSILVYGDEEYNRLCGPRPPIDALAGLSLFELRLSGTPPSAVAILRHVPSTLRVLELPSFLDHIDVVMPDLLPHYSTLRSLRLRCFTHTERLLVELCPNLEELMVFPGRESENLPEVLQPSLEHLLLMLSWSSLWGYSGRHRAGLLSGFMRSMTKCVNGSNLQSIRLCGTTWRIRPQDLSGLQEACKGKAVDLAIEPNASWPSKNRIPGDVGNSGSSFIVGFVITDRTRSWRDASSSRTSIFMNAAEWTTLPNALIELQPDDRARNKAVARKDIPVGSTVFSTPAFATVLQDNQKGHRCDYCLRKQLNLKRCSGCGSYWYCDAKCQNDHWHSGHKRICKKFNQFTNATAFQRLEKHERMDSLLLTHLLAHLSTLPEPYSPESSADLSVTLSLLPGPTANDAASPPHCQIKPSPPSEKFVSDLYSRFGNNNFTIHSHLNSIAHGVFPQASRLFNHSCVPNAVAKYVLKHGEVVSMEVVSLQNISAGEEVCIPYFDPALMQTRQQVFQITYGFTCECPTCRFLHKIGQIPEPPIEHEELAKIGLKLREFVGVEDFLKSGKLQAKSLDELPKSLRSVLNESYMSELSEAFSKASHEGDYKTAADSGVTLLALYLLVYPRNYPQIGMHLLEMAKTQWNHSFVASTPTPEEKEITKNIVLHLLDLARNILQVLGTEGDADTGPFKEIALLEDLATTV